jgi:uncharacterized protein YdeI (YjbR/CyaY-like superfamily)
MNAHAMNVDAMNVSLNAEIDEREPATMAAENFNPKVEAYLAKARPFAQPILTHLRKLVHQGCPEVAETIKWSRPFFEYRGVILCNMSAFNQHCSFGFWGQEISAVLRKANVLRGEGMGSLGRIREVNNLPPDKLMLAWIRQAAAFVDRGEYTSPIAARHRVAKAKKPTVKMPAEFAKALQKNKKVAATFAAFSPSCKREYIDWIADAKRPETRDKRVATATEWISQGKQRNWKYQNC